MLRIVVALVVAVITVPVQCQRFTLLNESSSYLSFQGLTIEPQGVVSLDFKTYRLNASLLYMQGVNNTFVYLQLLNGRLTLIINDGTDARTMSLPQLLNTNDWHKVQLVRTAGMFELTSNGTVKNTTVGQFSIMSSAFVGGVPDTPPFPITHNQVLTYPHLVGCVRRVRSGDNVANFSYPGPPINESDTNNGCASACESLDCDPDPSSNGACVEYYSKGMCDCRGVFDDAVGEHCNETATGIQLDGTTYKCYTLPQYSEPSVVGETIRVFVRYPSVSGTLMTGSQRDYRFSLYIEDQKVHYELFQDSMKVVAVESNKSIPAGTLQVFRTVGNVEISSIHINKTSTSLATGSVPMQFDSIRFTKICIGGGSLDIPIYSSLLQKVYYNLHYLSNNEDAYDVRNISEVSRVNFNDRNAQIVLPSNFADVSIELSFRTLQENAILLHVEDGDDRFHISINNSQVYLNLMVRNQSDIILRNAKCNGLNITGTKWYMLNVEVATSTDTNQQVSVTISEIEGTGTSSCRLQTSLITRFRSKPGIIGGVAQNVDGLMGCVKLSYNMMNLSLDAVLSDTIVTSNCQPCDILNVCNRGTCQPVSDYNFKCACSSPYFGDFCGMSSAMMMSSSMMMSNTSTIMTSSMVTTTPLPTTSTATMSPSSIIRDGSPTITISSSSSRVVPSVSPSGVGGTPTEGGGDDSNVGAVIGIVLAIIVGLLLLILVILIIIVVIRNRNNRQGFYQTYEGKGGEEMILKYSASLRSITRSGSASAENGSTINRVTKKEQEYYI